MLHFQMRSFLVLTATCAPIKQAGNPAFEPFLALEGHTISRRCAAGGLLRCCAAARRAAQTSASTWRACCASSCERLSGRRASRKHGCTAVDKCLAPAVPATAGGGRPAEADEQPTSEECATKERLRLRNSDELLTCFSKETAFGAQNFLRLRRAYRGFALGTVLPRPFLATLAVTIIPVTPVGGVATPGHRRRGEPISLWPR